MKKYTLLYIVTALLLTACGEAEFSTGGYFELKVDATWRDRALHCTAHERSDAGNLSVLERGFFITTSERGFNRSITTRDNCVIQEGEPFEITYNNGSSEGSSYRVVAYIKTDAGTFISDMVEGVIGASTPNPTITKITSHVSTNKADAYLGTIVIEGEGFSSNPDKYFVTFNSGIYYSEYGSLYNNNMKVTSCSYNKVVISFKQWLPVGTHKLYFRMSGKNIDISEPIVLEGIQITKHEPLKPRIGEIVTLYVDKIAEGDEIQLVGAYDWDGRSDYIPHTIVSQSGNEIKARVFTTDAFVIRDKRGIISPLYTLPYEPMKVQTLPALPQYAYSPYLCTLQGKVYLFDGENSNLQCYDPATQQWILYYPPINPNGSAYMTNTGTAFMGSGEHLYMWSYTRLNNIYGYYRDVHAYRFNINTQQFEELEDKSSNFSTLESGIGGGPGGTFCFIGAEGKLLLYHPDSGQWEETAIRMPSHSHLIGIYGDYIYYGVALSEGSRIYRQQMTTGEVSSVMDDMGDINQWGTIRRETLYGNYLYTAVNAKGRVVYLRVDLSRENAVTESLGFTPINSEFVFSLGEDIYICGGAFYKLLE
jgi:hypothetical protein